MRTQAFFLTTILFILAGTASAQVDTATCDGKRGWQRQIVREAIGTWLAGESDSGDLISLIQAEQGIAACAVGRRGPGRLHIETLERGLAPDQLGAVLLANELEWNGLVGSPGEALAGRHFRVFHPASPPGPSVAELGR